MISYQAELSQDSLLDAWKDACQSHPTLGLEKQTRANHLALPLSNQHMTGFRDLSKQSTETPPLTNRDVTHEYTDSRRIHSWKPCHSPVWFDHSYTRLPLAWADLRIQR